jgi:hypothetical protein
MNKTRRRLVASALLLRWGFHGGTESYSGESVAAAVAVTL